MLGLDITTSSVKLVELGMSGDRYRLEAYAAEPTPVNSVNEKAIVDVEAVGEAVRRAYKRSGARAKDAAVAISGDAAITKIIQMPATLSDTELEGQVELQADQYIPFPMEEVSYDFEVQGRSERDPDMLDVLLVATRSENVEQRQAAVHAAGLAAQVVDVEAFALENACRLLTHQLPDGGPQHAIAIVDFGASSTTFSVLQDLKVIYTRDFAFGGQQLTEEIMRTYGLSLQEAGRMKKEGGLPSNYQPEVLDAFIDDMTQQVSRSLQFFLASGGGRQQPDQIIVCGGCANIPGVDDLSHTRKGRVPERAHAAHPVRAADADGLPPPAPDRAALDQQVLHPRPAPEELIHPLGRGTGAHGVRDLVGESRSEPRRDELRGLHDARRRRRARRDRGR